MGGFNSRPVFYFFILKIMMLKKHIVILLFCFSINLTFGQSQPAVITVTPSSQTVYLNEPVSVVVGVQGVTGLFAISLTLSFNSSVIKCVNITQGNFLVGNDGGYEVFFETFPEDLSSANSVIVDQSILGVSSVSGIGDIFEITFEPLSGGTSQVVVTSFSLRDINNVEIPATTESAQIIVNPSAAPLITLTPSTQTAFSNEPASVVVGVQGVTGLFAISLTLSFNNSVIKCVNITQGNFLVGNDGGYEVFFETFPEDLFSANSVTVDQSILGLSSVNGSGNLFEITFEPFAAGTSQIEVTSLSLRDINNQEIYAIVESAEIVVTASVVNSKIFLQGPYDSGTGMMLTTLNNAGFLPFTQPYSTVPWNYNGTESVSADFFTNHQEVVDWVLIEIRTETAGTTRVATRAAFLKGDGTIVDLNGISPVTFFVSNIDEYYIVIKHRNHLPLMSSIKLLLSDITALYDFTSSQSNALGTNSMADLGGGKFGMYSADADGNGQVQNTDNEEIWAIENGQSGYKPSDFNLNGQVQNNDLQTYWMPNNGKGSQVPN